MSEEKITELEFTINQIKEKMIKPNSDSIEELEKRIKDMEPNSANHILYEQWVDKLTDYVDRIEELEKKFKKKFENKRNFTSHIEIIEKIEKLEKWKEAFVNKWLKTRGKQFIGFKRPFKEFDKELSELKEQYDELDKRLQLSVANRILLREALRELSSIYEDMLEYIKEDYDDGIPYYNAFIERIRQIKHKLGSEKTVASMSNIEKNKEVTGIHTNSSTNSKPPSYIPPNWQGTLLEMEKHKAEPLDEEGFVMDNLISNSTRQTDSHIEYVYDEHLSWKGNLQKMLKNKIVVKKTELKKWSGKIYEAINDEEYVIDEFEEMLKEMGKYLEEENPSKQFSIKEMEKGIINLENRIMAKEKEPVDNTIIIKKKDGTRDEYYGTKYFALVRKEYLKKWIWDLKHEISRASIIKKIERRLRGHKNEDNS